MKKMIIFLLLTLITTGAVFAASYNIDEHEDVNLSGVKKIFLELKQPNCALCISTGKQSYSVNGGGRNGIMQLSLEGDLNSNNRRAVPSLIIEESGSTVTVRLYKNTSLFFGLVKSGTVHFNAVMPEYFDGELEVLSSSGDTSVIDLNAESVLVKSSPGDITVDNIEAENLSIEASSGNITAGTVSAVNMISVKSSSGDISLEELLSESGEVKASSGRIEVERMRTTEELNIHASSGRIYADYLEARELSVDSSSGKIIVDELKTDSCLFDASSGDITVSKMTGGSSDFKASSGKISIDVMAMNGDIYIKSSSGDVTVSLPAGTGFDADLSASSGKIRSSFKLLGEVDGSRKNEVRGTANGGGNRLRVDASSGDITIEER